MLPRARKLRPLTFDFSSPPMWKRRIVITLLSIAALGGCALFLAQRHGDKLSIELTEQELQTRLAARFPIQNCSLVIVCLDITSPKLKLVEDSDRVSLSADLAATVVQRRYVGGLAFSGKVFYVAESGEFFLDDVEIHRFDLEGVPTQYTEMLRSRGPSLLRGVLANKPIYTLKNDNAQQRLARLALRDVRVVGGKLRVSFVNPSN